MDEKEAKAWVQALRLKVQGRTGVQIEAATGVSQSRLSRHLGEVGLSATPLLALHDSMAWDRAAIEKSAAVVLAVKPEFASMLTNARGCVEEILASREAAMMSAEQQLIPLVREAKGYSDDARMAASDAGADTLAKLEPLVAEVRMHRSDVLHCKDKAIEELRSGIGPETRRIEQIRLELEQTKAEASGQVRVRVASLLEEVDRSRASIISERDAAVGELRSGTSAALQEIHTGTRTSLDALSAPILTRISGIERQVDTTERKLAGHERGLTDSLGAMKSALTVRQSQIDIALAGESLKIEKHEAALQLRLTELDDRFNTLSKGQGEVDAKTMEATRSLDDSRTKLQEQVGELKHAQTDLQEVLQISRRFSSAMESATTHFLESFEAQAALLAILKRRAEYKWDAAEIDVAQQFAGTAARGFLAGLLILGGKADMIPEAMESMTAAGVHPPKPSRLVPREGRSLTSYMTTPKKDDPGGDQGTNASDGSDQGAPRKED